MSRNRNGIDRLTEGNFRRKVNKRHHHGKERTITVDVVTLARNIKHLEYTQNTIEVINSSLDSGTNVHVDNNGSVPILGNFRRKRVIVDFSHGQSRDSLGVHAVVPCCLEHAVVSLLGTVENTIGVTLPRKEDSVEVSLCAAGGNVTPVLILGYLPELGKEVDDRALELTRVHAVVGGDEGIAEVVDGELHKFVQLFVVVDEVVGVAEVDGGLSTEEFIVGF
mmetsp:Transcript_1879/g.2635  ORF Transcript_1879/g.2635 Transcript_1879/m.2635 type:complete len:222 (+) Transcript_1879:807-1472(+)